MHGRIKRKRGRNDATQITSLTRQEILGDMFYTGSLGYFAQLTALTRISEISSNAHLELAAGYGTFGYEPKVDYLFGFPIGIKAGGVALDIPMVVVAASNDGNKENKINFKIQTGILSSALEHATPEQMFNDPANPTEAISAVKALQIASAEGQRIYQITQANIDSVMPNLNLGAGTESEIRASVNAGLEVITHTDRVSVPGYTGEGYIILDPETGDGAYMIAGGGNGAFMAILSVLKDLLYYLALVGSVLLAGFIISIMPVIMIALGALILSSVILTEIAANLLSFFGNLVNLGNKCSHSGFAAAVSVVFLVAGIIASIALLATFAGASVPLLAVAAVFGVTFSLEQVLSSMALDSPLCKE